MSSFHWKALKIRWMQPRLGASMHRVPEMGHLNHHTFRWFSANTGAIDLKQRLKCSFLRIWLSCLQWLGCILLSKRDGAVYLGPHKGTRNGTVEQEMAHSRLALSVCGVQASNLRRSYLHILSKTYCTFIGIGCEFAWCPTTVPT